jgi:hypothetical protein
MKFQGPFDIIDIQSIGHSMQQILVMKPTEGETLLSAPAQHIASKLQLLKWYKRLRPSKLFSFTDLLIL